MANLIKNSAMLLLIDEDVKCTLADLIEVNSQPDTTPITELDLDRISNLKVDEYMFVGLTKIQRIQEEAL